MLGIIGGSGLYDLPGLTEGRWETVTSPFGDLSDEVYRGTLGGAEIAFLPRHGRGHVLSPTGINYRANMDGLKRLGVTDILSVSACGSFRGDLAPGTFVLVDQFIDRTIGRTSSFFGNGLVAHVSMADPACARLRDHVFDMARNLALKVQKGGTYIAMEGPQFSSRAESELYKASGADVIGMTNMPEAKLAREAEICYQTIAMVTDYDCWHLEHDAVDVADVIRVLHENADNAKSLIAKVAPALAKHPVSCPQGCDHALDNAIITAAPHWDEARAGKLDAVLKRYRSTQEQ